jgi:hypothetical protein
MRNLLAMASALTYPGEKASVGKMIKEARQNWQGLATKDYVNAADKVPLAFHPGDRYLYVFSSMYWEEVLVAITEAST